MTQLVRRFGCLLLLLFVASPAVLHAQVQATNGSIQGDVSDSSGSLVPGAAVDATEVETAKVYHETTNNSGHFSFPSLSPNTYTVRVSKDGFATIQQERFPLTVGRAVSLKLTLQLASGNEVVEVNAAPQIDLTTVSSANTLGEVAIATTPVLGRKFEDLLTLTPGVSITQGPDGDEININGQRGIFNNISLDGGDYNNGFFGEQVGGQRAAVDITLEAVKEFQVVASGANAEFGRTAGGVVNVITKSGTNNLHGSLFEYERLEALSSHTSDGQPLRDFHREQFGGSLGGALIKDKLFGFAASEGITENLTRLNLGQTIGTPCPIATPVFGQNITEAQIAASGDCQRQVLVNFYKSAFNETEGAPVSHTVRNGSAIGRVDWNISPRNLLYGSYNFDYSKNANQTFDVSTYGNSANGIEGPGLASTLNVNLVSTLSADKLNEAHVTYSRENRGRSPINPTSVPDTGIGFAPSFRFGQPFFLGPGATELFYRYDFKDNFSLTRGKHAFKFGGEDLYSHNTQIFDGFALGRYIFGDAVGFLHYATPATAGAAYGPNVVSCSNGSYTNTGVCPAGTTSNGSPLLLYLQDAAVRAGETVQQAGFSDIGNQEISFYAQDTWKLRPRLTLNYGLRWESQFFPNPVIAPSQTAYGQYLSDPRFPSTGYLPNQKKEFQPRVGFTYDVTGSGKSVVRANWGIFNARQNMLTQVGAITTNGAQQQTITEFSGFGNPTYPNPITPAPVPAGQFPFQPGVTVFDRNYRNPRIYTTDVGFDQQLGADYVLYTDFAYSKGVFLTRFTNPNVGPTAVLPGQGGTSGNADTVSYSGTAPFANLGAITNTISNSKSLYRGVTVGLRKRMTHGFIFDGNYVYSVDKDDDSNERDPFTFRYANLYNLQGEYSNSDRDERHKFNFYTVGNLPFGFRGNIRMQAHSAQPITDYTNPDGTVSGAPCSQNNSQTRFVNGIDCGRNHLRKDNQFFVFDFGVARPLHIHDRFELTPRVEVFNLFNNANNINPLSSPALFDFNGFLRVGVGDPRQAQLSLRFAF